MTHTSHLWIEPTDETREFFLCKELRVSSDIIGDFVIPAGFVTDGASIPIGLRWLFPFGGRKMVAAVVHDWLYGANICTKEDADLVFKELMEYKEVEPLRVLILYNGVHYLGGSAWTEESTKTL